MTFVRAKGPSLPPERRLESLFAPVEVVCPDYQLAEGWLGSHSQFLVERSGPGGGFRKDGLQSRKESFKDVRFHRVWLQVCVSVGQTVACCTSISIGYQVRKPIKLVLANLQRNFDRVVYLLLSEHFIKACGILH